MKNHNSSISHLVILHMEENTTQPEPTSKDVWALLLFWVKVSHLHLL